MTTGIALKNLKKAYLAKKSFIMYWLIVLLVIKVMNVFLMFGNILK